MKRKKYIECEILINFEENFRRYICGERLSYIGDYYGEFKNNKFYIGHVAPGIRNLFKTVLYGEIKENELYYWYGKDWISWILLIVLDSVFLIMCLSSICMNLSRDGYSLNRLVMVVIVLLGCIFVSFIPMFICSKNEKKMLLDQLKKICGMNL